MSGEVERIAAGLSEAQRRCLLGHIVRYRHASLRQIKGHLRRKGLITNFRAAMDFTPLGLAVRDHLRAQQGTDHD